MAKRYRNSFREQALKTINKIPGGIVMRADLNPLGSPRQVSRALNALVEDGDLIKLGYGIYAKTENSVYSEEPIIKNGFTEACIESLNRLGIQWELGQAIRDYNEGKTTQVPVNFIVRLKTRFRGKLSKGKRRLVFEGNINAQ